MAPPATPKIYHIVHVDRLASIVSDGYLWCDAELQQRRRPGTIIGMAEIKKRRLENKLTSHPGLRVGRCVPFYFCPRAVMLYVIHRANHPELAYQGGQDSIVHLEADLKETVDWANRNNRRWAFTLSNAGAVYLEDRCDLSQLGEIDWAAVEAQNWKNCKEGKQAEFLVEQSFPWELVRRVGAGSEVVCRQAADALRKAAHQPRVENIPDWYY